MAFIAQSNRKMWFGTKNYSKWIETPLTGSSASPTAWADSGSMLNGGGYSVHSYNSHKVYVFSWSRASSRQQAQEMMSFYSGSFGRGKLYFQDPLTYDTNVLPARWADPSITADFEGPSLVPGLDPDVVSRTDTDRYMLPVRSAQFDFVNHVQVDPREVGLYVTIPEGYTLAVNAFGESSGGSRVWVEGAARGGDPDGSRTGLTGLSPSGVNINSDGAAFVSGSAGAYVWIGGESSGLVVNGTITTHALHARLVKTTDLAAWSAQPYTGWVGGQGNEGVRFAQPPTYIMHSGVNDGQVEFAATLIETAF